MGTLRYWTNRLLGDVGYVFCLSLLVICVFLVATISNPDAVQELAQDTLDATAENFGWLYLLVTSSFVFFVLWLVAWGWAWYSGALPNRSCISIHHPWGSEPLAA